MTRKVWKYPIPHAAFIEHSIPIGAEILYVGSQGGEGQMWVGVDPDRPQVLRTFALVGTGHDLPDHAKAYVGSFQIPPYVWHLFEIVKETGNAS